MTSLLGSHLLLVALMTMTSSFTAGDNRDCVGKQAAAIVCLSIRLSLSLSLSLSVCLSVCLSVSKNGLQ